MKVVVVGSFGFWGQKLARVFCELGHEIVGEINLPDDGADKVAEIADRHGATAAVIATPPESHFNIAYHALNAGLDVLVEKPLALNAANAKALSDLAEDGRCVLSVDSTFAHSEVHEWLRSRCVPLTSFQSLRLSSGPDRVTIPSGWDLAVHDIAILYELGELDPKRDAAGYQTKDGLIAHAAIDLGGGGEAYICVGRSWHNKLRSIVLHYEDGESFLWELDCLWHLAGDGRVLLVSESEETLWRVVRDFASRCEHRELYGLTDGAHGVAVCGYLERLFGAVPHGSSAHNRFVQPDRIRDLGRELHNSVAD